MKLILILAVVACSNADKLDRTYLPPSYAQTSGGSDFLQTPISEPETRRPTNGFLTNRNNFAQNGNDFGSNSNGFDQSGNNYSQGDDTVELGNDFNQNNVNQDYDNGANAFAPENNYEDKPERPQAAFERNAAILRQANDNDGETYSYSYETDNGISAEESGVATNGVEAQGGYSYTGDDGQVYSIRYTAGANGFVPEGDHIPTAPPVPEDIQKGLEQNARDEANGIFDDGTYSENKYESEGESSGQNGYASENNGNGYPENLRNRFAGNSNNDEDSVVIDSVEAQPGFRNQGFDNQDLQSNNQVIGKPESFGLRNQARNGVAAQREYLPPTIDTSNGISQGFRGQEQISSNTFDQRNQGLNEFNAAAQREYLPPTLSFRNGNAQDLASRGQGQASNNQAFRNQQAFGQRNNNNGFNSAQREYLPPTLASRNGGPQGFNNRGQDQAIKINQAFGAQQSFGQRNQENGAAPQREYLPPTQAPISGNVNGFRQSPAFQSNGFRNQNAVNSITEAKTNVYLPPTPSEFGVRSGNGLSRQGSNYSGNGFNQRNQAAAREYLPPTQASFGQSNRGQNGFRGQVPVVGNQAIRGNQATGNAAASREYLPPTEIRSNNGFGSRLSQSNANARQGYVY